MNKIFFNRPTLNIIALSLVSFIEALQVLIIVALIYSFIPIAVPAFVHQLFPLSLYAVHLKRESSFYHGWILVALGLQALLLFVNRARLEENHLGRALMPYIGTIGVFVLIQIFAVFKILLWGNPWWARDCLYLFLGLGIVVRIFWPEFWRAMVALWRLSVTSKIPRWGYILMDAGVILMLIVMIFAPNLDNVLARMFSYDKFYHLDSFIMAPAWGFHQGLVLNRDLNSEYSLIIPILFNGLMKINGGFSYAHAVGWMIGLCALYYFGLYGLWRYWTGSVLLSFFAVVLAIKLQFFHWGVIPLIWIYPSATPLRFLPDVFFLYFMLRFTQRLSLSWLWASAAISGLTLVWTMDVGAYMYAVLGMAAVALIYEKGIKFLPQAVAVVLVPWLIAGGILSAFYGTLIGKSSFWHNTFEFAGFFLQGWGALPITEGLKDKQFFAFCLGFLIPVAYLGTLLYSLSLFVGRRSKPHLFMLLVSAYGLGLYHYFIHRSGVTSYYAVVIPLIFVLLFWAKAFLSLWEAKWQKGLGLFLCVWALVGLTTGYFFTYYPNVLNLSGYDWAPEKKFYAENFDFKWDAQLIDGLTKDKEPVALISSFETKIFMQANRPPFFYYFPMVESEHMQGEKLRGIYLHTYDRLARTLHQFQEKKPAYVFVQSRLYEGTEAKVYEDSHEGFKQLMAYIRLHYRYEAQGQYLTALKLI